MRFDQPRQDVVAEIVLVIIVGLAQRFEQDIGVEQIVGRSRYAEETPVLSSR
ncbi:hypothetical protein [Candidatus Accumulibacter sp. ACC003]|uniref:hypothetical protein n=1 Tax=Candidatus Accumulibacter sp. ACC003 TaxID=2823334 RepID=UPI0025BAD539|nr:hypothetical protein [Candidatus Accumulibacter sp. ACC003]